MIIVNNDRSPKYRLPLCFTACGLLLTSCMVGPDFRSPPPPTARSYTASKLPHQTVGVGTSGKAGSAQIYVMGRDIPAEWWYVFRSPQLNDLVTAGIANSPNLSAAEAALRQAQENVNVQIGNLLFPAFSLGLGGQRQRIAGGTFGGGVVPATIYNSFNATVNVSYTLDLFGGSRRQIEALQAQADYQQFQLLAAYLTLTTNIVTTSIAIASLDDQIKTTQALIKSQEDQLVIIRDQYHLGGVADTNTLTQETLVEQTRATLPPLMQALAQNKHALAVLVGVYPDTPLPTLQLEKLNLPIKVPVSLPSRLARQRPDIRAAEAMLHTASAQIGVATANLYPQIAISGNGGYLSTVLSSLLESTNKTWMIGATMTQSLYQGGALLAQRRAAIAGYEQAAAQYRQAVLQGFQNVADSLRAIDNDARTYKAQRAAEVAAQKTLEITKKQYQVGGVSYLNLLTAQVQYQQTRLNRIKAQTARYADTAALFQALGGGWWNRPSTACDARVNPTQATLTCP